MMDDVVQVVTGVLFDRERDQVLVVNNIGGSWSFPGGAVEKGENLKKTMIREAFEETGLHVQIDRLMAISEGFSSSRQKKIIFFGFFLTLKDDQTPSIQMPDEISEIKWVGRSELFEKLPWLQYDPWQVMQENGPIGFYQSDVR